MEFTLTPLADYACHTGEGPLYHPTENAVYWTDIPAGRLFRLDLTTGEHHPIEIGRPVGGFTLQDDGALLLFLDRGSVAIRHANGALTTVVEEIPDEIETRFNDVIAAPDGSVFCGTMPTKERAGRLYHLATDRTVTKLLDGIGCSNGCGFTPDRRAMYYTDSGAGTITRFAFDPTTSALTDPVLFAKAESGGGAPDGMTVDADGFVWSTRWDGACIVRYAPDGQEVGRIPFPVQKVSSATFGGPDTATLYVTTAGGTQKETDGALAGALFALTIPGVHGVAEFVSTVR
jgi:D-xylonolactonase